MAAAMPKTFFFEYNRASMAVFKNAEGVYTTHHFSVEPGSGRIGMWETWLRKGQRIFDGTYRLAKPDLTIEGTWLDARGVKLQLRERRVR
jgi:hypothetical protein